MNKRSATLLITSMLLLPGCIPSNEQNTLQARVNQQDQAIKQLQAQLAGVQPAQADTWSQVQTLRQEMASLKGSMDDFTNATAGIGGLPGLSQLISRHDAALRLIESQLSLNLQLGQSPAPLQAVAANPYSPAPQVTAPPVTQPSPTLPVAPVPAPVQDADISKTLYDSGYKLFTDRKYKESLNAFTDFTTTYPKHNLAGNAWFWKAESQYMLNDFAAAALDYEQVIANYPKNPKAPAAYLKQAMSFVKVNKPSVAKVRLNDLIKKFPKSPEATRAQHLLKELG